MVFATVSHWHPLTCSIGSSLVYILCMHGKQIKKQLPLRSNISLCKCWFLTCLCVISFSPVMDGSLPTSLKHIISNAEYYGPSLFLLGEFTVALQKSFLTALLTRKWKSVLTWLGRSKVILNLVSTGEVNWMFWHVIVGIVLDYNLFFKCFLSVLLVYSDGGCDGVCVPGAIPALLPAG